MGDGMSDGYHAQLEREKWEEESPNRYAAHQALKDIRDSAAQLARDNRDGTDKDSIIFYAEGIEKQLQLLRTHVQKWKREGGY